MATPGLMPLARRDAMVGTSVLTPQSWPRADAATSYWIKDGSQLPWVKSPGEGSRAHAGSFGRVN